MTNETSRDYGVVYSVVRERERERLSSFVTSQKGEPFAEYVTQRELGAVCPNGHHWMHTQATITEPLRTPLIAPLGLASSTGEYGATRTPINGVISDWLRRAAALSICFDANHWSWLAVQVALEIQT